MPGWYMRQKAEIYLGVSPNYLNTVDNGGILLKRAWCAICAEAEAERIAHDLRKK